MLLRVRDLKAYYGRTQALGGVDFELKEGGVATLLGANGAGKTTTLRALCGMVRTEGEIVLDGARIDARAVAADMARVYEWFPRLQERRRQQAGTLSGGEQQMLAVGRAAMLRPRLMLLDEPSFGLAPLIIRELFDILRLINRETGVAMLIVEQNAQLALDLADSAYVLETGRVAMSGPAEAVRADEGVRRSYLGY